MKKNSLMDYTWVLAVLVSVAACSSEPSAQDQDLRDPVHRTGRLRRGRRVHDGPLRPRDGRPVAAPRAA